MNLDTPVAEEGSGTSPVRIVEAHFDSALQALSALIERFKANDLGAIADTDKTIIGARKAMQTLLDERKRIEDQLATERGSDGGVAIDFDAARDEIGRRLACLRAAGGSGPISG